MSRIGCYCERPRFGYLLAILLAAAGILVLVAPPALATPSSTPDETWATDGRVNSMVQVGDKVYLGGLFRLVGPNVGNGAAVSTTDGKLDAALPKVNGTIWATMSDGSGGWYIGGEFSKVGSYDRSRLAHVLADGTVDASWNPGANNTVNALALSPDAKRLYVGGKFTTVGGITRSRLAAVDATGTGAVNGKWNPRANNTVNALAVSADGGRVYAGGAFTTLAGGTVIRNRLAALDGTNGTADPNWNPDADNAVNALAVSADGGRVYAGGDFASVGGAARDRLAALDGITGAADTAFNPSANNTVHALAVSGTKVYAGGTFTALGGAARYRLGAVDAASGALDASWDPKANNAVYALAPSSDGKRVYAGGLMSSVNGVNRDRLAAIDASTGAVDTQWNPKANSTVYTLAVSADGRRIYAGGGFTRVGGTARNYLASIDVATGAVDTQWNASADNYVRSLSVSPKGVYVGGDFTAVNGQGRTRLARVDGASGALDPDWRPTADNSVLSFYPSSDGTSVYVGGAFSNVNGQARRYLWALDTATGAVVPSWQPNFTPAGQVYDIEVASTGLGRRLYAAEGGSNALGGYDVLTGARSGTYYRGDGDVQSLAILNGKLYAGGHFRKLGGLPFDYFASLDLATGKLDTQWTPNGFGHAGPWALLGDPSRARLYAGGDFTSISGQPQQGFAKFSE